MIPDFLEYAGILPAGIHVATWTEIVDRFGNTQQRKKLLDGLCRGLKYLKSCGCTVVYIDGSFATNRDNPKDIDVCWESDGVDLVKLKNEYPIFFDFLNACKSQKDQFDCEFRRSDQFATEQGIKFLEYFQIHYEGRKGIVKLIIDDL